MFRDNYISIMKVLIWSNEHKGWWRPMECGYTTYKSLAGEYTMERAIEICNNANKHLQFDKHYPNEQDHAVQPNELIFPIYD